MRPIPPAPEAVKRVSEPPAPLAAEGTTRPSPEEIVLVDALGRGEPWAAVEVWNRHQRSVRRLLARALGPRADVDDLTQEVFMRVFSRIGVLRDPGALREFVIAVAVNALKGELRRRWVRRKVLLSDDGAVPDIEVPGADSEAREALAQCYAILDKLGARERAAFVLRYMEERTLEEVAAALEVSLSTAKRLIQRSWQRVSARVGSDQGLRNFFDRRQNASDAPPEGANTTGNTGARSNVNG